MSKQYFNEVYGLKPPENYERFFVPAIGEPLAEDLIRLAALRPGERVLDVGCGTGIVARLASQQVGSNGTVAGLDVNPGMLEVARFTTPAHMSIEWHEGSAEDMPLPDEAFDVVLCQLSLQFMADKLGALQEMRRVLVSGGRLILNVPGPTEKTFAVLAQAMERNISSEAAGFVNLVFSLHDTTEIQQLIGEAGFRKITVQANNKVLYRLNGIVFLGTPPSKRLGVMLAQDGNRWVVTMGGYLGDHAPTDYPGFLESARMLPAPHIYNVIKDAEPLGEPVAYKFPANLRHHYEKLARFPEGYVVLGDALCSFNPIYGQGMTVAAMEAKALDECLNNGRSRLAQNFFARASKIIDVSWSTAVGNDLGYPEVEGPRTPLVRFLNWYLGKVHLAAHNDARVSIAFLRVINMTAPPPSIMQPGIVWRVLKGNLWASRWKDSAGKEGALPQRVT